MVAAGQLQGRAGFQEWVAERQERGTPGTRCFCLRQSLLLQNTVYKLNQHPYISTCNIYANFTIVKMVGLYPNTTTPNLPIKLFANVFIAQKCSFSEIKINNGISCLPVHSHFQHPCHFIRLCQYLSQIAKKKKKPWICKNSSCYLPLTIGQLHKSLHTH